jgi:hypothetical protein
LPVPGHAGFFDWERIKAIIHLRFTGDISIKREIGHLIGNVKDWFRCSCSGSVAIVARAAL